MNLSERQYLLGTTVSGLVFMLLNITAAVFWTETPGVIITAGICALVWHTVQLGMNAAYLIRTRNETTTGD